MQRFEHAEHPLHDVLAEVKAGGFFEAGVPALVPKQGVDVSAQVSVVRMVLVWGERRRDWKSGSGLGRRRRASCSVSVEEEAGAAAAAACCCSSSDQTGPPMITASFES